MSVRLRFKRMGKKGQPFYRLCAFDARTRRDGRALEELGHYNPLETANDKKYALKRERIEYWLSVGAQPSDNVAAVLKQHGISPAAIRGAKKAAKQA
ncbi:MAG: 30S ribosomal protein S16 [Planctomycetota bacterium]